MAGERNPDGLTRRRLLTTAAGCAGSALVWRPTASHAMDDDDAKTIVRSLGRSPVASDRIRLIMPGVFPNGYTVPLTVEVDSLMTESDHVKSIRVLAPKNPIVDVATFRFAPGRSRARVATHMRLAAPQVVVAAAEMGDGSVLMASTFVEVASNGCK